MSNKRDRVGINCNYDRAGLIKKWNRYYGSAPPKGLSRKTLELAVAYHQQARTNGGLPAHTKQTLLKFASGESSARSLKPTQVSPGARLVREWNGQVIVVDVLESGYLWGNTIYKSLSEIARTITGTRWSGPRFFGIKQ